MVRIHYQPVDLNATEDPNEFLRTVDALLTGVRRMAQILNDICAADTNGNYSRPTYLELHQSHSNQHVLDHVLEVCRVTVEHSFAGCQVKLSDSIHL